MRLIKNSMVVATVALLGGCANRPAPIPLPGIELYSRNGIVCLPTGVGNAACGLPGWILLTPFGFLCEGTKICENETFLMFGAGLSAVLIQTPAYVCGAATGTWFIPLSFLADEKPCSFM
jgi:hypothetical protein